MLFLISALVAALGAFVAWAQFPTEALWAKTPSGRRLSRTGLLVGGSLITMVLGNVVTAFLVQQRDSDQGRQQEEIERQLRESSDRVKKLVATNARLSDETADLTRSHDQFRTEVQASIARMLESITDILKTDPSSAVKLTHELRILQTVATKQADKLTKAREAIPLTERQDSNDLSVEADSPESRDPAQHDATNSEENTGTHRHPSGPAGAEPSLPAAQPEDTNQSAVPITSIHEQLGELQLAGDTLSGWIVNPRTFAPKYYAVVVYSSGDDASRLTLVLTDQQTPFATMEPNGAWTFKILHGRPRRGTVLMARLARRSETLREHLPDDVKERTVGWRTLKVED